MMFKRVAPAGRRDELDPGLRRLLWLIDTHGSTDPVAVATVIQMFLLLSPGIEPFSAGYLALHQLEDMQRDVRRRWYGWRASDLGELREFLLKGFSPGPQLRQTAKFALPMFEEVRAILALPAKPLPAAKEAALVSGLVPLPNPFQSAQKSQLREGFKTPVTPTRQVLHAAHVIADFVAALPAIFEWITIGNGRFQRPWSASLRAARTWHQRVTQAKVNELRVRVGLSEGMVLRQLPEGWTLVELKTSAALDAEGAVMHHCVGSYSAAVQAGRARIFSLRDPSGAPKITFEIGRNANVYQAKGPYNSQAGHTSTSLNSRAVLDAVNRAPTFAHLAAIEGLDLPLVMIISAVLKQELWHGNNFDLELVRAVEGVIRREEAAKARELAKLGRGNRRGRRDLATPVGDRSAPPGLTFENAQRLWVDYNGAKKGKVSLGGTLSLQRLNEGAFGIFDRKAPLTAVAPGRKHTLKRIDPNYDWSKVLKLYVRQTTALPHVEIYPDFWRVRVSLGSMLQKNTPTGGQYLPYSGTPAVRFSPLMLAPPARKAATPSLAGPWGQVESPFRMIMVGRHAGWQVEVPGAFRAPDWVYWEVPMPDPAACGLLVIDVDHNGVPLAVKCEQLSGPVVEKSYKVYGTGHDKWDWLPPETE